MQKMFPFDDVIMQSQNSQFKISNICQKYKIAIMAKSGTYIEFITEIQWSFPVFINVNKYI